MSMQLEGKLEIEDFKHKDMDSVEFFEVAILSSETDRIDPSGLQGVDHTKEYTLIRNQISVVQLWQPGQQLKALKGPNRQFILGSTGTGKTTVLGEKAFQLLQSDFKVLILAPDSSVGLYKELFISNNLCGYEIRPWRKLELLKTTIAFCILKDIARNLKNPIETICKRIAENPEIRKSLESRIGSMAEFDAVLIDDAIDQAQDFQEVEGAYRLCSLTLLLVIMGHSQLAYPDQMVWMAFDHVTRNPDLFGHESLCGHIFKWALGQMVENDHCQNWSCIVLDTVLRSSDTPKRQKKEDFVEKRPDGNGGEKKTEEQQEYEEFYASQYLKNGGYRREMVLIAVRQRLVQEEMGRYAKEMETHQLYAISSKKEGFFERRRRKASEKKAKKQAFWCAYKAVLEEEARTGQIALWG